LFRFNFNVEKKGLSLRVKWVDPLVKLVDPVMTLLLNGSNRLILL
jgi:hypothetical protein